ncbi:MAG TPA: ElyC/SanA/YdcF family protein [Bacillota bacterium]|nr:ElyC/SanA/YdcF family protein [Bacillota bacterium]
MKVKSQWKQKTWIRILLRLLAVVLGIFFALSGSIIFIYAYIALKGNARTYKLEDLPHNVDCIIVPGAQVLRNRAPSPMLQDRLDGAVAMYRAGVSDRILVSGDHREDNYNEPLVMYKYLIKQGIPDEAIFMDHFGLDTYDTVYRAIHVFKVKTAVIATQRFHLQRALYIGGKLGLDCVGYATDPRYYASELYMFIREIGARLKAVYEIHTDALPGRMSPAHPISGDGRGTRQSF